MVCGGGLVIVAGWGFVEEESLAELLRVHCRYLLRRENGRKAWLVILKLLLLLFLHLVELLLDLQGLLGLRKEDGLPDLLLGLLRQACQLLLLLKLLLLLQV